MAFGLVWNSVCGRAAAVLVAVLAGSVGYSQTNNPGTTEDALHAMEQRADVVFTGQVTAVRRREGAGGATGVVEVDFAVADAVRGVSGALFTLREWAGLWALGSTPFRVGERYLMLLHAAGPSGLSSPVDGADGAIPIRGAAQAVTGPVDATVPAAATGQSAGLEPNLEVDLRWIATRVVHAANDRSGAGWAPVVRTLSGQPEALPQSSSSVGMQTISLETTMPVSPAEQRAPYGAVLQTLRGWDRSDRGRR